MPVLKEINSYGWSLCGGLHSEESALWRELGWDWRFVGWSGHTTVEAKYDGKWHYLDVFLKFYAWMPDADAPGGRTIAGEDDLTQQFPGAHRRRLRPGQGPQRASMPRTTSSRSYGEKANWLAPAFLTCGDTLEGVIGGLKTHHAAGRAEGWAGINHATGGYSADVGLAPGFALTNTWDAVPGRLVLGQQQEGRRAHTCGGHKDLRNDPGSGLVLEPYVTASRPAAMPTAR